MESLRWPAITADRQIARALPDHDLLKTMAPDSRLLSVGRHRRVAQLPTVGTWTSDVAVSI